MRLETLVAREAFALFNRIRNDHEKPFIIAYYLEYLVFHMPEPKLVPALKWLIRNDLIGQKFVQFVHGECKHSGLELIRHLTMRLERDKKPRKLFAVDVQ